MEIVDLPHLPEALYGQLAELSVLNGDPPMGIEFIRKNQRLGGLSPAPYYGVYAVEAGELLAKVEVVRPQVTGLDGVRASVVGVADVFTRPDAVRHGYSGALLAEVHRREAEEGRPWSMLWTQISWGAHRLYERLGYSEVFRPWTALLRVPSARESARPSPYRLRAARRSELPALEALRARAGRGRVGFTPAFPRAFSTVVGLGWRSARDFRILARDQAPVGFACVAAKLGQIRVSDVAVTSPRHAPGMIDSLERLAAGRWLVLETTTFVRDHAEGLRARGFRVHTDSHRTLMAKRLGDGRALDVPAVCRDPRFMCGGFDRF